MLNEGKPRDFYVNNNFMQLLGQTACDLLDYGRTLSRAVTITIKESALCNKSQFK